MAEDFSPEEKLLRLIKGKRQKAEEKAVSEEKQAEGPAAEKAKASSPGETAAKKEYATAGGKETALMVSQKGYKTPAALPHLNYIYIITAMLLAVLFGIIFLNASSGKKEKQDLQELEKMISTVTKETEKGGVQPKEAEEKPSEEVQQAESKSSFDDYQRLIENKNIFTAPTPDKGVLSTATGVNLREMAKGLRLVGIIPGDEPQAVIEDKTANQTFFLKKGERILDIEIRDIKDGRVVLGYGEETIELSL